MRFFPLPRSSKGAADAAEFAQLSQLASESPGLIYSFGRDWLHEVTAMDGLPPMHVLEAEAHKRRAKIIEWAVQGNGGWEADGSYVWRDPEVDVEVIVWPDNRWISSTGTEGHRVADYGLIPFMAMMRADEISAGNYSLAQTAWWFAKRLKLVSRVDA